MLDILADFIPLTVVIFLSFIIITVIETFVIKAFKRLESPKNLFYAIAANVAGFLLTLIVGALALFAFLAFFSTTLGGAWGLMILSGIALVVLIALIPILIFVARFLLLKSFGVTEDTKFRVIYSIASTIGVIVGIFILQFLFGVIVTNFFPNLAV